MKIRALRTIRTDAGNVRRGDEAEVSAPVAKSLIERGLAEAVGKAKARSRPRPHVASRAAPKSKPKEGAPKAASES